MNPERTTNGVALPATEAGDAPAPSSDPAPSPGSSEFDPYKFQEMSVSPTLRMELSQSKLERLGPEYFQDTVPPNRPIAAPVAAPVEAAPHLRTRKRRIVIAVALLMLVAIALRLHARTESPAPSRAPEQTAPRPHETVPATRRPGQPLQEVEAPVRVNSAPKTAAAPEARTPAPTTPTESAPKPAVGTPSDTRPRLPSASAPSPGASGAPPRSFWNEPR